MRLSRGSARVLFPAAIVLMAGLLGACPPQAGPAPAGTGSPTARREATRQPATPTTAPSPPLESPPAEGAGPALGVPCPRGPEDARARLEGVEQRVLAAMDGYPGKWGLAFIDIDCGAELVINPEHVDYVASAGKILVVIAAMRAVEAGRLEWDALERHVRLILIHSSDELATELNAMVTPREIREVLELSGVSPRTSYPHSWHTAVMPAPDLARVWQALLTGRLLSEHSTALVLGLASQAEIPERLDTFPAELDVEGYQYGQKAGYYVTGGRPYYLVGAGYLKPEDRRRQGFVAVLTIVSMTNDLREPQRRAVFPILLEYVLESGEPDRPPAGG
jgi:CubicO group peptidase (beta-lactamase class C family)